jgi:hypothetical protein
LGGGHVEAPLPVAGLHGHDLRGHERVQESDVVVVGQLAGVEVKDEADEAGLRPYLWIVTLAEIFELEKWLDFHPRIVDEIVIGTKITKNV